MERIQYRTDKQTRCGFEDVLIAPGVMIIVQENLSSNFVERDEQRARRRQKPESPTKSRTGSCIPAAIPFSPPLFSSIPSVSYPSIEVISSPDKERSRTILLSAVGPGPATHLNYLFRRIILVDGITRRMRKKR
jgi:hypothetical protein